MEQQELALNSMYSTWSYENIIKVFQTGKGKAQITPKNKEIKNMPIIEPCGSSKNLNVNWLQGTSKIPKKNTDEGHIVLEMGRDETQGWSGGPGTRISDVHNSVIGSNSRRKERKFTQAGMKRRKWALD